MATRPASERSAGIRMRPSTGPSNAFDCTRALYGRIQGPGRWSSASEPAWRVCSAAAPRHRFPVPAVLLTSAKGSRPMWQHVLPSHVAHDDRDRFVIAAHHPDRLRRPLVSPGAASAERFQQALLWNVFRTLELLTPSFWLRRFHIRLTGEAALVPPQISRVHLWQHLPLPPIQRIDGGRSDVVADVVIE